MASGSGTRKSNSDSDERYYFPVWKELKAKKKVVLSLTPQWHKRVKKAVAKEKDMDIGYKLECVEARKKAQLTFTSNNSQLTITLTVMFTLDLENL